MCIRDRWLPISSTGHMILVDEIIRLDQPEAFKEMFLVVIQLGAILAVAVMYFHRLNPFSPSKNRRQREATWALWIKIIIACIPAAVLGLLLDDWMEAHLYNAYVVAAMLLSLIHICHGLWFMDRSVFIKKHLFYTLGQKIKEDPYQFTAVDGAAVCGKTGFQPDPDSI